MKTKWNEILDNREMERVTTQFALGMQSVRNWYNYALEYNVGKYVSPVTRRQSVNARNIARKALKRRRILNSFNLPVR